MSIWAIADLHLSFGVPNKKMDIFGDDWKDHPEKIRARWEAIVHPKDLVLLAGDFSWAMTSEEVLPDFEWLDSLPGTKVLIKGNHDYWWQSISKVRQLLPPSCHVIQNDAFHWEDVSIAGSRLWDTQEYSFREKSCEESFSAQEIAESERIFARELQRLEVSLKALNTHAKRRIAMTHYPPISEDLKESKASRLLEKYGVELCVFGHLHHYKPEKKLFGEKNGIRYVLTACDYIQFCPLKLF